MATILSAQSQAKWYNKRVGNDAQKTSCKEACPTRNLVRSSFFPNASLKPLKYLQIKHQVTPDTSYIPKSVTQNALSNQLDIKDIQNYANKVEKTG